MVFEVDITREELHRAVKAIGLSSFRRFKNTWTYRLLAGISISVVLAFGALAMAFLYRSYSYDHLSFLLMILLFVVYVIMFRLITSEFTRFIVYSSKRYAGPVRYKISDDYLFVMDAGITSRFGWNSFINVEDTGEFLLLYIDLHQAVIIPKRDDTKELAALALERARPAAAQSGG